MICSTVGQVRTARQQWMQEEDGGVDDCTAIVCFLTRSNVKPGALASSPQPQSPKAGTISRPSISRRATLPHILNMSVHANGCVSMQELVDMMEVEQKTHASCLT